VEHVRLARRDASALMRNSFAYDGLTMTEEEYDASDALAKEWAVPDVKTIILDAKTYVCCWPMHNLFTD
jgi:hypothetical protein